MTDKIIDSINVSKPEEKQCKENRELEHENKKLKSQITSQDCEIYDLKSQLQAKEQECEELKEKIKAYQEDRFCQGGCAIYQYDKIHKLTQTLDKIEEFCIVYSNNHDTYETVYKYILDIINKAKEQKWKT